MAAYAATVTTRMKAAKRIAPNLGILVGEVDITNYNPTTAEITGITGKFKAVSYVILNSVGENGNHIARWTGTSVFCRVANTGVEVAADVDVGKFVFVAYGEL